MDDPSPLLLGVLLGLSVAAAAEAQENVEVYLGGVVGVSALSADTTSSPTGNDGAFAFSHYAPENGPVLNLFAGAHVTDYITFQANYRWNRNDLTSVAASSTGAVSTFRAVSTTLRQPDSAFTVATPCWRRA